MRTSDGGDDETGKITEGEILVGRISAKVYMRLSREGVERVCYF